MIQGADVPLYIQPKSWIKAQIAAGRLEPSSALPGERQLAEAHRLSRSTVRAALNELVAEGVLFRRHGKGTFVSPGKVSANLAQLTGLAEELRYRGLTPQVRVLAQRWIPAPGRAASALKIPEGEPVAFIVPGDRRYWPAPAPSPRLPGSTGGRPSSRCRRLFEPYCG